MKRFFLQNNTEICDFFVSSNIKKSQICSFYWTFKD